MAFRKSQCYATVTSIYLQNNFHHFRREPCTQEAITPHPLKMTNLYFVPMDLPVWNISHKWIMICELLMSGFSLTCCFPSSHSSMYQYFVPFSSWRVFHCMYVTHFIYSFVSGHLGRFQLLAVGDSAALNIFVQVFVWTHAISFGNIHRNKFPGLCGRSRVSFLRDRRTVVARAPFYVPSSAQGFIVSTSLSTLIFLFKNFKRFILEIYFWEKFILERIYFRRKIYFREHERERERSSSGLHAECRACVGLDLMTMRSPPEPKPRVTQLTAPPRHPCYCPLKKKKKS